MPRSVLPDARPPFSHDVCTPSSKCRPIDRRNQHCNHSQAVAVCVWLPRRPNRSEAACGWRSAACGRQRSAELEANSSSRAARAARAPREHDQKRVPPKKQQPKSRAKGTAPERTAPEERQPNGAKGTAQPANYSNSLTHPIHTHITHWNISLCALRSLCVQRVYSG